MAPTRNGSRIRGDRIVRRVTRTVAVAAAVASAAIAGALGMHGKAAAATPVRTTPSAPVQSAPVQSYQPPVAQSGGS